MKTLLTLSVAAAALCAVAVTAPASAAERKTDKTDGIRNGQATTLDLSARRYYRRYGYYGPRYRYYGGGPYYSYGYYPYGYYPYYRGPGIYFGFY